MTRRIVATVVPALLMTTLTMSPARAAEDVLGVIPEGALGFAVVNHLGETDAKIQELGKLVQMPVPSPLGMLKLSLSLQKRLDEKGAAALVMMPGEDGSLVPIQILFVPVTDFGQFVGQFNPDDASAKIAEVEVMDSSFLVGSDGGYAVFAEPKHREVLESALASPHRVAEEVAPLKQWLAANDVGVVIMRKAVELISTRGQEELKKVKTMMADMPADMGADMQAAVAVFDVYGEILEAIGDEVQTYAAAARVADDGSVYITDWALMTPGGSAAEALGQVEAPKGNLLAGLPSGPFVIAGAGAISEKIGEALIDFSVGIMKAAPQLYGIDEEQAVEMGKISRDSMRGIRGMGMLMGVGEPDGTLLDGMAAVMKVDDSQEYLTNYQKTIQAMNELAKETEGTVFSGMELEKVQIGDLSALKLTMKIPVAPQAKQMPGYDEMMKTLFGPGGSITAYIAAADEETIVSVYTDAEALRKCVEAVKNPKSGLAADAGVIETAALLPPGAQWVGYWSPQGTVAFASRMMDMFAPDEAMELPEFPDTPPIGFAAKATTGGIRGYMVVPASVIKSIGEYIVEFQKTILARPADLDIEVEPL